jgi:hypothetical protein
MGVPFAEPLSLSTPLGAAAIYFHPHNSNKETQAHTHWKVLMVERHNYYYRVYALRAV